MASSPELNFDIIRNKGSEGEYSKKDIMGYLMNISDAAVEKTADGYEAHSFNRLWL